MLLSTGDIFSEISLSKKEMLTPLFMEFKNGWNNSCKYLRPRVFCLEHALQIEELLQSKGGASVLVICHRGEIWFISVYHFGQHLSMQ